MECFALPNFLKRRQLCLHGLAQLEEFVRFEFRKLIDNMVENRVCHRLILFGVDEFGAVSLSVHIITQPIASFSNVPVRGHIARTRRSLPRSACSTAR